MAFKKLTAGLMASSMILGLAATASAEITTATPFETAVKMNKLGIVVGNGTNPDGTIDFNLGGNLTRAELVTTIVRSFGAEQAAQLAKGAPSFADVQASEWFSGYVAVAKNLAEQAGTTIGRDANTFDPTANVSKAEALVFVMKFLGVKVSSTGANWYEAWIAKAVELGMISEADAAIALANPGSPATRGEAFVILDFGYSAKVLEGGASLYTAFVDSTKPTVEASAVETTSDTTVTVSGKVSDNKGVAAVFVNGTEVAVKDGNFSAEVELKVGENSIEISATDVAGNSQAKTLKVTRSNAAAEAIEAADIEVAAGEEVAVNAKLVDANGAAIADAEITGTSDLGKFEDGKFIAGTKSGEGKLTLKSGELTKEVTVKVNAGALAKVVPSAASVAKGASVELFAQDQYGNVVEGATFTSDDANAFVAGNKFVATASGNYKVTATKGSETAEGNVGVFGTATKVAVKAPNQVVGNNGSVIEVVVSAVDANGNMDATSNAAFVAASSLTPDPDYTNPTKFTDGKATLKYVAGAGLANTTATITVTSTGLTTGSAAVSVVSQVPTSIKVTGSNYVTSNDKLTGSKDYTIKVLDQDGKDMATGIWAFDLALTGPASFSSTSDVKTKTLNVATGGSVQVWATENSAVGAATLTASFAGLTAGTKNFNVAFAQPVAAVVLTSPTDPTAKAHDHNVLGTVASGEFAQYSVSLADKYGVPNTVSSALSYNIVVDGYSDETLANVRFSNDGGATWSSWYNADSSFLSGVTSKADGSLLIQVFNEVAEEITLKVTSAGLTSSSAAAFTTKANAVSKVKVSSGNSGNLHLLRGETNTATVTAQLYDAYDNKVAKAGVEVVFAADTYDGVKLAGTAAAKTVKTDANGVASVEVSLAAYLNNATISATSGTLAATGSTKIHLDNTVAASMNAEIIRVTDGVIPATVTSGTQVKFRVTLTDNAGRTMKGALATGQYSIGVTPSNADLWTSAPTWAETAVDSGIYESSAVTLNKAENLSFEFKLRNSAAAVSTARAVTVVPSATVGRALIAEAVKSSGNNYDLKIDAGSVKAVTINLADAAGNPINSALLTGTTTVNYTLGTGVELRNENGLTVSGGSFTIPAGRSSYTLYVVAPATLSATSTFTLNAGTALTFTLK